MTDSVSVAAPEAVRRLDTPAAAALARLAGTFDDLQTVLVCCEGLLTELAASRAPDEVRAEALWTLALASYARCFAATGGTPGLTSDEVVATGLGGEVLQWHQALLQVSRRHTTAADNPRETFSVGVSQDATGSPSGIAITSARQPRVDEPTVRQAGAIAYALARVVDRRIGEQQQSVFTEVAPMTREQLAALPLVDVAGPPVPGA